MNKELEKLNQFEHTFLCSRNILKENKQKGRMLDKIRDRQFRGVHIDSITVLNQIYS